MAPLQRHTERSMTIKAPTGSALATLTGNAGWGRLAATPGNARQGLGKGGGVACLGKVWGVWFCKAYRMR